MHEKKKLFTDSTTTKDPLKLLHMLQADYRKKRSSKQMNVSGQYVCA